MQHITSTQPLQTGDLIFHTSGTVTARAINLGETDGHTHISIVTSATHDTVTTLETDKTGITERRQPRNTTDWHVLRPGTEPFGKALAESAQHIAAHCTGYSWPAICWHTGRTLQQPPLSNLIVTIPAGKLLQTMSRNQAANNSKMICSEFITLTLRHKIYTTTNPKCVSTIQIEHKLKPLDGTPAYTINPTTLYKTLTTA